MDVSIGLWLLVAVIIFWLVGLYNRLMRLRARAIDVLNSLEIQVQECANLIETYTDSISRYSTKGASTADEGYVGWLGVANAVQTVRATWEGQRRGGLTSEVYLRRSQSWTALQDAWANLLVAPPDLAGARVPIEVQLEWNAHQQKANAIRDVFNSIVNNYNNAIQEYPAAWVANSMGFEACATI